MVDDGSRIRFDLESVSFPKTQHIISCAFLLQAYDRSGGVMGEKGEADLADVCSSGLPEPSKNMIGTNGAIEKHDRLWAIFQVDRTVVFMSLRRSLRGLYRTSRLQRHSDADRSVQCAHRY